MSYKSFQISITLYIQANISSEQLESRKVSCDTGMKLNNITYHSQLSGTMVAYHQIEEKSEVGNAVNIF